MLLSANFMTGIYILAAFCSNRLCATAFSRNQAFIRQRYFTPFSLPTLHYSSSTALEMRGVKKENLPSKVCVVCNRPFTWRKKWEKVWDDVSTCSKSCNAKRRAARQQLNKVTQSNVESLSDNKYDSEDEATTSSCILTADDADRQERAARKARKKAMKAERRAQRQGKGNPSAGQKQCDVCTKSVNLLIRCTIDETQQWKMVCGNCWHSVSGGVVDGDTAHPHYRYGGLWKNRRAQNEKNIYGS